MADNYGDYVTIYLHIPPIPYPTPSLLSLATSALDTLVRYFPPAQIIPEAQLKPTYIFSNTYITKLGARRVRI